APLYEPGKLVSQGEDPELFARRWVASVRPPPVPVGPAGPGTEGAQPRAGEAMIGSDECGKGDYFGPLVVAAVRLEPGEAEELRLAGVRDSKEVADEAALRLGGALRSRYAHAIARLDPERYNAVYRPGRLNDLLADLHARAIR